MANGRSLQEPFLDTLRKEQVPVYIFLVNGIKLQGKIEHFDQYVILLQNSTSQIIYKHAISTIVPVRKIVLQGFENHNGENVEVGQSDSSGT